MDYPAGVLALVTLAVLMADPMEPSAELMKQLADHNGWLEKLPETHTLVVETDAHEADSDGKVLHRTHSVSKQVIDKGKRLTTVASATRDGADDRERAQKEADERDGKDDRVPSPFLAASQPRYRFTQLGSTPEGWLRLRFTPKNGPSTELLDGEAWVDPKDGELVRMTARLSKNPAFVDRLTTSMELDGRVDGRRALSKLSFDGAGGFLFFKRQGGATLTFRYEPR